MSEGMRATGNSCLEPKGSSGRTLVRVRLSVKRTCTQRNRVSSLSTFIGSGNRSRLLSGAIVSRTIVNRSGYLASLWLLLELKLLMCGVVFDVYAVFSRHKKGPVIGGALGQDH